MAKLLIDHGANINSIDMCNRTPLDNAKRGNKMRMIDLLLAHGAISNRYKN